MIPVGQTSPCGTVAASRSPSRQPPCARAVRAAGSTSIPRSGDRSIITVPSATAVPATLCPPPRTVTSYPAPAAKRSARRTSATLRQRTMWAGRRSCMPFQTRRACS